MISTAMLYKYSDNLNLNFKYIMYLLGKIVRKTEFFFGIMVPYFVYYFTIVYCASFCGDFSNWGKFGNICRQRKRIHNLSIFEFFTIVFFIKFYEDRALFFGYNWCFPCRSLTPIRVSLFTKSGKI